MEGQLIVDKVMDVFKAFKGVFEGVEGMSLS